MSTAEQAAGNHIPVTQISETAHVAVELSASPMVDAVTRYAEQAGHEPTETAIRLGRLADQGLLVMRPGQRQLIGTVAGSYDQQGQRVA